MRSWRILLGMAAGLALGCAGQSQKTVEVLDPRTGVTVGVLDDPIEFVQLSGVAFGKRSNFAYLGPVEWNRMGSYSYGLWVHIAPGNDVQPADIRAPAALSLLLDDGPMVLTPIDPPALVGDAYRPVVSWGQTAYFALTVPGLKRLAASRRLDLQCRAVGGGDIAMLPSHDTRAARDRYVRARGLIGD